MTGLCFFPRIIITPEEGHNLSRASSALQTTESGVSTIPAECLVYLYKDCYGVPPTTSQEGANTPNIMSNLVSHTSSPHLTHHHHRLPGLDKTKPRPARPMNSISCRTNNCLVLFCFCLPRKICFLINLQDFAQMSRHVESWFPRLIFRFKPCLVGNMRTLTFLYFSAKSANM